MCCARAFTFAYTFGYMFSISASSNSTLVPPRPVEEAEPPNTFYGDVKLPPGSAALDKSRRLGIAGLTFLLCRAGMQNTSLGTGQEVKLNKRFDFEVLLFNLAFHRQAFTLAHGLYTVASSTTLPRRPL